MAHLLAIPPRPAPYVVTSSSPTCLSSSTASISPKTLVVFQDLDGSKDDTPEEYEVQDTVAKLMIHDVSNMTIRVSNGVVTTLELFNLVNVNIVLSSSSDPSEDGAQQQKALYGTVTLDPSLDNVRIHYTSESLVGFVIFTTPPAQMAALSMKKVQVTCASQGEESVYEIVGEEGIPDGLEGQLSISWKEGWYVEPLERKEKDYPQLR